MYTNAGMVSTAKKSTPASTRILILGLCQLFISYKRSFSEILLKLIYYIQSYILIQVLYTGIHIFTSLKNYCYYDVLR